MGFPGLVRTLLSTGRGAGQLRSSLGAIWSGMTLCEAMDHIGVLRGGEVAVVLEEPLVLPGFEMTSWTYAELAVFVKKASGVLMRSAGVRPGQRVALCTRNMLDMPLLTLSISRCGAVAVPLNQHLSAEEIRFIVEDSRSSVLVVDMGVLCDVIVPWIEAGEVPEALERVVVSGDIGTLDFDPGELEILSLWELFLGDDGQMPPCPASPQDVCAIFYTSGTTGFPKGAMLTSESLLSDQRFLLGIPGFVPRTVLLALPMAHIMGFAVFLSSLLGGVKMVYLHRFLPDRVLDWMESGEVDAFLGVPSMYQMLEEAGAFDRDLRGVKVFASAADVMPGALIERFKRAGRLLRFAGVGAAFVEAYGSVELSGAAMLRVSPPGMSPAEEGFVGWPLPGYKVRILDGEGAAVAPGQVGELWIKGPGVLKGYLGQREATRKTIDTDGWLCTGDLAAKTRLGTVRFAGREKDMIKSGGYSVFPAEIEAKLLKYPGVTKAVVVGVKDLRKGAVPVAALVVESGEIDLEDLRNWITSRVARYKVPREIFVLDEGALPYGPTGKVLKRSLSAKFEALRAAASGSG